jgi:hypothetical protein
MFVIFCLWSHPTTTFCERKWKICVRCVRRSLFRFFVEWIESFYLYVGKQNKMKEGRWYPSAINCLPITAHSSSLWPWPLTMLWHCRSKISTHRHHLHQWVLYPSSFYSWEELLRLAAQHRPSSQVFDRYWLTAMHCHCSMHRHTDW